MTVPKTKTPQLGFFVKPTFSTTPGSGFGKEECPARYDMSPMIVGRGVAIGNICRPKMGFAAPGVLPSGL